MPPRFAVDPSAMRAFVLETASSGDASLASAVQTQFGVSRATAHNYLRQLEREGVIRRVRKGRYALVTNARSFDDSVKGLEEHEVWERRIKPLLPRLPENALTIWEYGCTEMVNNVIDHSESDTVRIEVTTTPKETTVSISDYGVGIFRKIARALHLEDDRHSVLELSKGKVTTDPAHHTGEGIYFSSRAFDRFWILSGGVYFAHDYGDGQDWILGDERPAEQIRGTTVSMALSNTSERKLQDIFDEYATDTEDYRFDRTVVPVKLLQYGDERLVSRSQAKRLLARFDRFRTVVLNFEQVESIGQSFADEVFRVFPSQHPEIDIVGINANEQVTRMMNRARSERQPQGDLFASQRDPGPEAAAASSSDGGVAQDPPGQSARSDDDTG